MSKGVLSKPLRAHLENTVKLAREVAEGAAQAALYQLGVGEGRVPDHLSEQQKAVRRRLRAHGRALGDTRHADGSQTTQHLVWEVAYEQWHRMLFARFLAENYLLMWEPGAAVTLAECEELVRDPSTSLGAKSSWDLAGKLAARMLPQVFKANSPAFALSFSFEHQRELERLLAGLREEVFKASDSLGWVYQFWQAKRKGEINASEVKIGADELPAVTQLFTEPYMVEFQLHNSLGAWWVARFPNTSCPVELTYLRRGEDGAPVAGQFEGWPDQLRDFRLLDPCCGSGHFLVAAFLMLVPMRMVAEGLSPCEAVDAVLAENLYGLELDARCVEIAVFAIALAAWRYPDETGNPLGVRANMPAPHVACCGLKVVAPAQAWAALVPGSLPDAAWLRQEMRALHASFAQAPLLGSLLDPSRVLTNDLATPGIDTLITLLQQGLAREQSTLDAQDGSDDSWDIALSAQGLLEAARILSARYHLVITNVPYKKLTELCDELRAFCERAYPAVNGDLANVFLERCIELSHRGAGGVVQIVMPQNWLFLTTYKKQRKDLLRRVRWNLLARLGENGFDSPQAAGAFTILLTMVNDKASPASALRGIDASAMPVPPEKAGWLAEGTIHAVNQLGLLRNPDAIVILQEFSGQTLFAAYASCLQGTSTGDNARFVRFYWEMPGRERLHYFQGPADFTRPYGGRESVVLWDAVADFDGAAIRGEAAWGSKGVAIGQMRSLPATIYTGQLFSNSTPVIIPRSPDDLAAVWCFCTSPEFHEELRRINPKLSVDNGYVSKIEVDFDYWREEAGKHYANGLPKPYSDDATQWIFHGHPQPAPDALQVAVARLLGYTWPGETNAAMELSEEARSWTVRCQVLAKHADDDGIVCLPAVRGEKPGHERLLALLIDAWETVEPGSWKNSTLDRLLADADCAGKGLDVWLGDKFFEQHAKLFGHRPFIWHVWDGLKDGFGALVNYHNLDAKKLERLIHTYLGDWVRTQEAGVANGVDGAQQRLAAALQLKLKLEAILEGEQGYDIFVRWKQLDDQPIGWNPDLNDGVRLNIRPFMTAGVLRHNKPPKLNIKWDKDRGKDTDSAPWFEVFAGDRLNDHHLTLAEKRAARNE